MAENYRDPKVTTTEESGSGGMGKMIMYAVIALLALLLLAWLFGLFGGDDEVDVVAPTDGGTVVVDDAEVVEDAEVIGDDEVVVDEVDDGEVVVTE